MNNRTNLSKLNTKINKTSRRCVRVILFDLQSFDFDVFLNRLYSVGFESGVSYSIDLFVVPYDKRVISNYPKGVIHQDINITHSFPEEILDLDLDFFLLKNISFDFNDFGDFRFLFLTVFYSISHLNIGYYSLNGNIFNKAFCIKISRVE